VQVEAREAKWCPGTEAPAYLTGSIPGDFGFDPLGLGKDPTLLASFQEKELMNGRWAMLAFPGIIATEAFGYGNWIDAPNWALKEGEHATYFGTDLGPTQLSITAIVEVVGFTIAEGLRAAEPNTAKRMYPGFDPAGLAKGADFEERKLKEIKNGRLAMVAMAGIFSQGAVTHEGPLEALAKHLADPAHYNVATSNSVAIPIFHASDYVVGNNAFWESALPPFMI